MALLTQLTPSPYDTRGLSVPPEPAAAASATDVVPSSAGTPATSCQLSILLINTEK